MFAKCREQLFPTIERKLGIMESDGKPVRRDSYQYMLLT
jgi:hypothetical protein